MPTDSTVEDLDGLWRKAKGARARLEPEWFLCLAYYYGNQWLAFDSSGRFWRPPMPKGRITVVDNRIQPAVRVEIARMTRSDPTFTVAPNTSDQDDTEGAMLGEQVMRYLWKHLSLSELTQKALMWSRVCGAGFLKTYWDSTLGESTEVLVSSQTGEILPHPQTGKALRPGQLPMLPGMAVKQVSQGDLKVEVRSPFQMFIDPLADSFSEAEWVIEESVKSAEYVKRRYGIQVVPDTPANPGLIEARMGDAPAGMGSPSQYKGVKVREYWSRPSVTHPQGRRAVWVVQGGEKAKGATSKLLQEDNQPFDPMPYVMLSGIPVPGRLWPTSIAEQLRGPQTELNKARSQLMENASRVGNPTLLASKQAVQDPDKFTQSLTVPGGVNFYDDVGSPNAKPDWLAAPPLPEYVANGMIPTILESIQEISGQHDVSSAQVPPGVTAAAAINLLQEADDTRLGPAIRDYNRGIAEMGQKLLKLVARYYTDERTIRLAGDNGIWQIIPFRGSMLRENTHVEVQSDSGLSQSKALKQAQIQNLMTFIAQTGMQLDGQKLAQFLRDSEMGGLERLVEELSESEQQVDRENVLLSMGQQLNINDYDDDEAHVKGHQSFQRSARYAQLPPNVQQTCEAHVTLHQQRMAQKAMQQAQLAQQAQMQAQQPPPGQMQMQMDQGQQQMAVQAAQAGQQSATKAADAAQSITHAQQLHEQQMAHRAEKHALEIELARRAAQQQTRQGAPSGRS